jgi:dienelactone hydrolase
MRRHRLGATTLTILLGVMQPILASLSLAAACLLAACATQTSGSGRDGVGAGGRGDTVAVAQRGRGVGRGGLGRGGRGRGGRAQGNLAGVQVREYRFEETGEMLEYAVFVSSKVDKGTKSPLVIALHGRTAQPTTIMRFARDAAELAGFIVAAPMGYHDRGWYGLDADRLTPQVREYSEKDVMNVLAFMRSEFDIDENRIYIMGSSMGGAGALFLAAKHPDLWAAVAAGAPPLPRGQVNFAAMRHLPVFLVHGDRDAAVSIEVSRNIVTSMKELGMTYEFREIPGGAHPHAMQIGAPWMISFFERHAKSGVSGGAGRLTALGAR